MKQERQKLQSTKPKLQTPKQKVERKIKEQSDTKIIIDDFFPDSNVPNLKTNEVLYSLIGTNELNVAYSDLTGRFPIQSSRGNNYILVAFHPDGNAILVQALKNRTAPIITQAWIAINERFKKAGVKPLIWIMDNECSKE